MENRKKRIFTFIKFVKNTMRPIYLIALILTSTFVYSQDCKYKKNEVDEFTKHKILETKSELFTISGMGLGFSTNYSLLKVNENRFLKLTITSPSIFTLEKGSDIMFKVEAENAITLTFPESIVANGSYNTTLKSTHWNGYIIIPISEENYQRFLNEKISKLRVYTSNGYIDDDISEKRDKKFKNLLSCIQ